MIQTMCGRGDRGQMEQDGKRQDKRKWQKYDDRQKQCSQSDRKIRGWDQKGKRVNSGK